MRNHLFKLITLVYQLIEWSKDGDAGACQLCADFIKPIERFGTMTAGGLEDWVGRFVGADLTIPVLFQMEP